MLRTLHTDLDQANICYFTIFYEIFDGTGLDWNSALRSRVAVIEVVHTTMKLAQSQDCMSHEGRYSLVQGHHIPVSIGLDILDQQRITRFIWLKSKDFIGGHHGPRGKHDLEIDRRANINGRPSRLDEPLE